MTEKRVSVRLAAVGGRQVRAELEGIGTAGARGFGRLSAEMEAANVRLAAVSRKVAIAAGAAVAAAAAAGVAMVRSGLATVDAQAKLAQSLGTTVASIQVLARAGDLAGVAMSGIEQATKDLTRRLSQAAAGGGPASAALDRLGLTAKGLLALPLDERVGAINAAIARFVPAAERAAVAGQLFGEEGSIALNRIDSATLRQATADVTAFGVAVSEQDADRIERTNDAISRLGLVWTGLSNQLAAAAAPALEAVANAMALLANRSGPLGQAIRGLFDTIGRLAASTATFAVVLGGRWVAGLAAAALSVRGLATALVVLRGALLRTGIGALIVGAGELVYQFARLVQGAGGFGAALGRLGDLAAEVWDRLGRGAGAVGATVMAAMAELQAGIADALQAALAAVTGFANRTIQTFDGALKAVGALWGALPGLIGDLAFQAANALITGVEAMLNGVVTRINGFVGGINAALEALGSERRITLLPEVDLGRIANRFAGAGQEAADAARAAFARAFAAAPLAVPDLGLGAAAESARATAEGWRQTAATLGEAARAPLAAIGALTAALEAASASADGLLDPTPPPGTGTTDALDDTTAAAGRAGGAMKGAAETASDAWKAAQAALERTKEIAQGLAEDITGPIKEALTSGEISWQSFAGAISGIAKTLANRLIDTAFKPIEDALLRAFSGTGSGGGLFGWLTSAIGGLFGAGGAYAKGAAFGPGGEIAAFAAGGPITAFASGGVLSGGIVTRPTVFPFARGIGLMGEAGPEAILPLRRGPGGRLGVEAGGATRPAAPAPPSVSITPRIVNVLDPALVGDYLATPAGERAIVNVIRRNRGAFDG